MTQRSRLSAIVALLKGTKNDVNRVVTDHYHLVQKNPLFAGITKTYQPSDDGGEQLPGERTIVQRRVPDLLNDVSASLSKLFDITATQDFGNTVARGEIKLGGDSYGTYPVTYLLFLEKQLRDLTSVLKALPTLDPSENWTWDENALAYRADDIRTARSKKIPRNHVKAPATDKHPAQVEVYFEDTVVGTWTTRKFSGAVPAAQVREALNRVTTLQEAVKTAREEANATMVENQEVGRKFLDYVTAPFAH